MLGAARPARVWRRFAALGDSFTEGLGDELRADGRHRGWSDRTADGLAASARDSGVPDFEYANLAVRGRLVAQIIAEQVPAALSLGPDLVTLGAGVNDTLRPRFDLDAVATAMERGVRALRSSGADVLLFEFGDPSRRNRLMAPVAERIRALNAAVDAIADEYGCFRLSFWQVAVFDDPQLWAPDWLHLAPTGHEIASRMVLAELGVGRDGCSAVEGWRTPLVPARRPPLPRRAAHNVRWTREHLVPWAMRRARGESSGDLVSAKQPAWRPWPPESTGG